MDGLTDGKNDQATDEKRFKESRDCYIKRKTKERKVANALGGQRYPCPAQVGHDCN